MGGIPLGGLWFCFYHAFTTTALQLQPIHISKGLENAEQMAKAKSSLDDTVMAGTWNYGIMLLYHTYRMMEFGNETVIPIQFKDS